MQQLLSMIPCYQSPLVFYPAMKLTGPSRETLSLPRLITETAVLLSAYYNTYSVNYSSEICPIQLRGGLLLRDAFNTYWSGWGYAAADMDSAADHLDLTVTTNFTARVASHIRLTTSLLWPTSERILPLWIVPPCGLNTPPVTTFGGERLLHAVRAQYYLPYLSALQDWQISAQINESVGSHHEGILSSALLLFCPWHRQTFPQLEIRYLGRY